jgi:glycosyltransferase involved in cell wall biosynthesis
MTPEGDPAGGRARTGAEIALLHYTAPPVVGGVETLIARHAVLMADAGYSVRIVAGRGEAPDPRVRFTSVALTDSLHPEVLSVGAELAAGKVGPRFWELAGRLETELATALDGVELAILHNVASLNRNLALTVALRSLVARPAAPRIILWHHDLAWTLRRYQPALHEGEPWSLLRTPWPGAVQVTISEARRQALAGLLGLEADSIAIVPGGVDLPEPGQAPGYSGRPRRSQRPAYGSIALEGFDPLLLTPARVTLHKNIELGIRAVAALRAAGQPAGLVVTGPVDPHDRGESRYLERLLTLRRRLGLDASALFLAETPAGSPSREFLDSLYLSADALFLPSWDEGFGLPILEAAVRMLPIVCSDLPSLRELGGEEVVYIDPSATPRQAARAVVEAIDRGPSAELARRLAARYTWPNVYRDRIEPLLARALAGR